MIARVHLEATVLLAAPLALILACGGDPSAAPPPEENTQSSSVAAALASLQDGQTPDPTPVDREPPAVPDDVAERAPDVAEASGGSADSPACKAARKAREDHKARIERYRDVDVVAAEQRWINAKAALDYCGQDFGGCASDGEEYKKYLLGEANAKKAYEQAQFNVGQLEAEYYKLDQEISAACGTGR